MKLRNTIFPLLTLLASVCAVNAQAAELNVAVAARIIAFRQPPSGPVTAAIIFDPGDAASAAEAGAIERSVGGGIPVGKVNLRVKRVPIGQLGGLAGTTVAFITSGLRDSQAEIATAAAKGSILTITSDLGCVQAGRCAAAVSTSPKVQITVSKAACQAAHVQFGSAFLMLVKEL